MASRNGFKVQRKDKIIKEFLVTGLRQALADDTNHVPRAFDHARYKAVENVTQPLAEESQGQPLGSA